jgi:hypothetical protein
VLARCRPIEANVLFNLLHFGDGPQAFHYFVLCFGSIIGVIQAVAIRYNRRDLIWIEEQGGYVFGALAISASFLWFFLADEEIFIPGLAGGELFTVFLAALVIAIPVTRLVHVALVRLRLLAVVPESTSTEEEPLS